MGVRMAAAVSELLVEPAIGCPAPLARPLLARIFLSTGDKPMSASKAVKGASKIVPRWKDEQLINPSTKTIVWNHRPMEYTVATIQEGDERGSRGLLPEREAWVRTGSVL